MIELDEIQEPKKSNYTPIVILGVVALLLVVIGFIGYKDFIDSHAEKKVSETKYEKDEELEKLKAQVQQLMDLQTSDTNRRDPTLARIDDDLEAVKAKVESINRELSQSMTPRTAEDNLFGAPPILSSGSSALSDPSINPNPYPRTSSSSSIPPAPRSLDRSIGLSPDELFGPPPSFNGGSNGSAPKTRPKVVDSQTGLTANELFGPPPGAFGAEELALNEAILNAVPSQRITPHEQQILDSPALGSVTSYSADGLLKINAGSSNNLRPGMTLQVRRGTQVLGKIQIEKVYQDESVAFFLNSEGSPPPQAGDQLISSF